MVDTNSFVLAFEVASILLLVALIGAVAIARETQ
jgi:NADH:ubiquinone oxidoreductase subunit 6 (subunit J)